MAEVEQHLFGRLVIVKESFEERQKILESGYSSYRQLVGLVAVSVLVGGPAPEICSFCQKLISSQGVYPSVVTSEFFKDVIISIAELNVERPS